MRLLVSISVPESWAIRYSEIRQTTTADTTFEQSLSPRSQFPGFYDKRSGLLDSITEVVFIQHGARFFVSTHRTVRANTSLQPTATSRGLRHGVTLNSITPSRWLLSHPSCRRSIVELAGVLSQVAVAELFR